MLADEITADLRQTRDAAIAQAHQTGRDATRELESKGVSYGKITAHANGSLDTSQVDGVDADLRVKPFFHHGGTISIREFVGGAFNDEMGLQAVDSDLMRAHNGARVTTRAGMVLDGAQNQIKAPPTDDPNADPDGDGVRNEIPQSLVDYMEFYLLNYFKPAQYRETEFTELGRKTFQEIGCAQCHIPDLQIKRDRRVADVETKYDPANGIFNNLFSTATPLINETNGGKGIPTLKRPKYQPFLVRNIFTDFKRHDLGANFYERNFDGTLQTEFMTTALWGVGSTSPYGHDGRSVNLHEVILRHGGEAQRARDRFANLSPVLQASTIDFLQSLIIFLTEDTASNLDPGDRTTMNFPQFGHGSVKLTVLFNNPNDPE